MWCCPLAFPETDARKEHGGGAVLMHKDHFFLNVYVRLLISLCISAFFLISPAWAQTERIMDFFSTVIINQDGSLLVTENITAWATGDQIRRGIVREFPTEYSSASGKKIRVGFSVVDVLRDSQPEPYHTKSMSNGVAIYMGDKDVLLAPGRYTYTITYTVTRQLGFFPEYDELYWNVNGNGWRLPLDRVRCRIHLPDQAPALSVVTYEGFMGSTASRSFSGGASIVELSSSRPYAPLEGLTIAISWPKGFATEPGRVAHVVHEHGMDMVMGAGLVLVFCYYLLAWVRVGRDPEKGVIVPLFSPPQGFSPAMVRMLSIMRFDNTAFTAGIVNMAVQGALHIEEVRSQKSITLSNTAPPTLAAGEKAIWQALHKTGSPIVLKQSQHRIWELARKSMEYKLDTELRGVYFTTNAGWMAPALFISLIAILLASWFAADTPVVTMLCVWITGWSFGCYMLLRQVYRTWKQPGLWIKIKATGLALTFALPFFIGEVAGIYALYREASLVSALCIFGMAFLHVLFFFLLKAPTRIGRQVMDEIEGFRMYLAATEKDRLNFLHPPDETPQLFEKLLPYAIALGVENAWGSRFAAVLAQAGYEPNWYTGSSFHRTHPGGFAAAFSSSMAGSIASAATAPGSSSGSGGGGSSGGGGGGGGGGGW